VDIHSSLFDPKRAHLMYNDSWTNWSSLPIVGSSGRSTSTTPWLRPDAIAQPDRLRADPSHDQYGDLRHGNSISLYNPPTRGGEEFAMIDVISGAA